MKQAIIWIIIVLIVIAGIIWFVNRTDIEEPLVNNGQEEEESIEIDLNEQNDSGVSGTALLTEVDGGTRVELDLDGAPEDIAQPAHIHSGTCADIGEVVYPLEFPMNGESETTISVSLDDLRNELPLAINVHQSPEEIEVYVACGDIEE
ncbi:MAG: hypothetical protein WDZ82_00880 [Candidatus Paceibacterota bacterium]